jgi:hypothetical protein
LGDIQYLLTDTFKSAGVDRQEILDAANAFWLNRFFTNEYCAVDEATPGAAAYLVYIGNMQLFRGGR